MADGEIVDLPRMNESSAFTNVTFVDIRELYTVDSPIIVRYKVSLPLRPSINDHIGLFRIAWLSTTDHIGLVQVPPSDASDDESLLMSVTFHAKDLALEEGEFYQFCYLTEENQVRGVSIPFQFVIDDFEIVSCSDQLSPESFMHAGSEPVIVSSLVQSCATVQPSTEVISLRERLTELETIVSSVTAEISNIRLENERLTGHIESMQESNRQENTKLFNELELTTRQRDEKQQLSEQLSSRVTELEAELSSERRKISELDTSLRALQDAQGQVATRCTRLSREKTQLESEVSRLTADNEKLSTSVVELNHRLEQQYDFRSFPEVSKYQTECLTSISADEQSAAVNCDWSTVACDVTQTKWLDQSAASSDHHVMSGQPSAPNLTDFCQQASTSTSALKCETGIAPAYGFIDVLQLPSATGAQQTVLYPYPYPIPRTWFPNPYADYVPELYRSVAGRLC